MHEKQYFCENQRDTLNKKKTIPPKLIHFLFGQ